MTVVSKFSSSMCKHCCGQIPPALCFRETQYLHNSLYQYRPYFRGFHTTGALVVLLFTHTKQAKQV